MSPRVVPRDGARPKRSSLEEFRARSDGPGTVTTYPTAFWKYLTASDPYDIALHHEEQRALSRATAPPAASPFRRTSPIRSSPPHAYRR